MRNLIRNLLCAVACAIPVYANAAGLVAPVCSDDLPGIVNDARTQCASDPLGCLFNEISTYNIQNVVSDLSVASSAYWQDECLLDNPFACDLTDLQRYGLDTLVDTVSTTTAVYCKENPGDCSIVISDIIGSGSFGEIEPNDIWTEATELTRDVPRFGQTRSARDVDWYMIKTNENNTAMNIWFPESTASWNVEVQDANGAVLAQFSTVSDGETQTNYKVHAPNVGMQYIRVSSPPGQLSQLTYQIAVNLTGAEGGEGNLDYTRFGEIEPNDIWTQATKLTRNVPKFGQTRSADDVDWYMIETYENNTAMNIWFAESTASWSVEVQDANGTVLAEFPTIADGATQTNYQVHAPNYGRQYIRVSSPQGQFSQLTYQIAVNLTGAQGGEGNRDFVYAGETEPNDFLLAADLLESNQTIIGQSYGDGDEDWYLLETRENNTLLKFIFGNSASTWDADFTNSDGEVLASFTTIPGGVFEYEVQAANIGKYYLKLSESPISTEQGPYEISLIVTNEAGGSPQPDYNYFVVERENNDTFSRADTLGSSRTMSLVKGQLIHYSDFDFFRIDTLGNETIKVEMCPQGTECYDDLNYGSPGNYAMLPWAVYLFDHSKVNDSMLAPHTEYFYDASIGTEYVEIPLSPAEIQQIVELRPEECLKESVNFSPTPTAGSITSDDIENRCKEFELQPVDGFLEFTDDHLYYLAKFGVFGDGLVGMIDPAYPSNAGTNSAWREITFSMEEPGTYYIAISDVLAPSENYISWEVISREDQEGTEEAPDNLWYVHQNYTADQYTFRITRTQFARDEGGTTTDGRNTGNPEGGANRDVKALLKGMSPFL